MQFINSIYYRHNANVQPVHISKHVIPYYDMTIVQKGVLYYVRDNSVLALKQGDVIIMRPGEVRQRLDSTEYSDYISFNFTTDMNLDSIPGIINNALDAETNYLLSACDRAYDRLSDDYLEEISFIIGALLIRMRGNVAEKHSNPLALKIKNYIQKNYAEQITLQSISNMFHFSASYCNNIFKKEYNQPIIDFLIDERIRNAKEQLIHTTHSLSEISQMVGYDDYNYFSRLFKKNTRYSPIQYRKLYS